MKNKFSKVLYLTENSLASAWIKSVGIDVKDCPKYPLDLDPRKHLKDECKREKDKQHLTPLTT